MSSPLVESRMGGRGRIRFVSAQIEAVRWVVGGRSWVDQGRMNGGTQFAARTGRSSTGRDWARRGGWAPSPWLGVRERCQKERCHAPPRPDARLPLPKTSPSTRPCSTKRKPADRTAEFLRPLGITDAAGRARPLVEVRRGRHRRLRRRMAISIVRRTSGGAAMVAGPQVA